MGAEYAPAAAAWQPRMGGCPANRAVPAVRRYNDAMSDHSDEARKARAAARRDWPVRKFRLGHEPGDDLSATTTAEERLAMMWPLAMEAWTLAGRPIPDYERRNAPIRVIRPPASRTNT